MRSQLSPSILHVGKSVSRAYEGGCEGWVYRGTELMTRLLRVNWRIYHEATPVLYTRFTFTFGNPRYIWPFLKVVPRNSYAQIRSISVDYHNVRLFEPTIFSLSRRAGKCYVSRLLPELPSLWRVTMALHVKSEDHDVGQEFAVDRLVGLIDHFHRMDVAVIMSYHSPSLRCEEVIGLVKDKLDSTCHDV